MTLLSYQLQCNYQAVLFKQVSFSCNPTQLAPFFFITQAVAFNMTLNGTLMEEIEKVLHISFRRNQFRGERILLPELVLLLSYQDPFGRLDLSIIKVVAMTIGEIEYTRFFTDQQLFSPTFSRVVFLTFCVMMPIVLMNLTVGTFSYFPFLCVNLLFFLNSQLAVRDIQQEKFFFFLSVYQVQKQPNHKFD